MLARTYPQVSNLPDVAAIALAVMQYLGRRENGGQHEEPRTVQEGPRHVCPLRAGRDRGRTAGEATAERDGRDSPSSQRDTALPPLEGQTAQGSPGLPLSWGAHGG